MFIVIINQKASYHTVSPLFNHKNDTLNHKCIVILSNATIKLRYEISRHKNVCHAMPLASENEQKEVLLKK